MSKNTLDRNKVLDIGIDSIVFMGTKYILHHGLDMPHVHNLNGGDIGVFIATDGIYHIWFRGYFETKPFDTASYNCEINKWGSIMAGDALLNLVTGRKDRIMDNLISVGISGLVSTLIDSMREKSRCQ